MAKKFVYLDHAAATPVDRQVMKAIQPFYAEKYFNPAATYQSAVDVKHDIESARRLIGQTIGVKPGEIIFTSGGTEANNLAVNGIMNQYPDKKILTSAIEHESVLSPARNYKHGLISVDDQAMIDPNSVGRLIDEDVVLVSILHANNEVGSIQHISKIAKKIEQVRVDRKSKKNNLPIYFHIDACQSPNYLEVHPHRLGVDLMTVNGGKIYGPKQSGLLYVKAGVKISPQILGGGQQRGLRSGTESAASVVGLAKALKKTAEIKPKEAERLKALQEYFFKKLTEQNPKIIINGSRKYRLANNLHFTVPGKDNERLIFELDELGVLVAAGSACNASDDEPSHVLRAMGISSINAQSSLRLSMGRSTTKSDIDFTLKALATLAS
jgi:cysteine desulfurase